MKYHHWAQDSLNWWICPCIKSLWIKAVIWFQLTVNVSVVCVCAYSPDEDSEEVSMAPGGRQNHDNLYRVNMPSLYSCGSSYGSETSIPAGGAHTVSNAPVTEYMWVKHTHTCMTSISNTYEHIQVTCSVLWGIHGVFFVGIAWYSVWPILLTDSHTFSITSLFGSSMWHHSFITDKLSHSQTKMTMEINTTLFRSQTCFV